MVSVAHISIDQLQEKYIAPYLDAFVDPVREVLHVPDIETERTYLLQRLALVATQQTFFFVLLHNISHACIGAIEIRGHEHPGQLYCWLHPNFWGKHYFQIAMVAVSEIYFSLTQAHYFTARVDIENLRSYFALKKTGFIDYRLVQGAYGRQFELILRRVDSYV